MRLQPLRLGFVIVNYNGKVQIFYGEINFPHFSRFDPGPTLLRSRRTKTGCQIHKKSDRQAAESLESRGLARIGKT